MKRLVLLDSNSLLNRAFYAIKPLTTSDGRQTNAVYGYLNMLMKIINDYKPTHIIATFDVKAPTFRKELYDGYKAQRKPMPEELAEQLPIIKELLTKLGICIIERAGFEADDVIGTLSKKCDYDTIIVTGDKDSLQLISDTTTVLLTKKGISEVVEYTPARLAEDGLIPSQVIDLKSLMGDASDNIPGVAGVGEKTAMDLLSKYSTLDGVYANIDEVKGKLQEKLIINKEMAYLSYTLATIKSDMDLDYIENNCELKYPFPIESKAYLLELNFNTVINRISFDNNTAIAELDKQSITQADISNSKGLETLYNLITDHAQVAIYINNAKNNDDICIAYSPILNYNLKCKQTLIDEGLTQGEVESFLSRLYKDATIHKLVYDAKNIMHINKDASAIVNYDDLDIKSYIADANKNYKGINELLLDYGLENGASSMLSAEKTIDDIITKFNMNSLYETIELPLVKVLYDMEDIGVRIDVELMDKLRTKFSNELADITHTIYDLCGEQFNINSPKQLAVVLFEKLQLKHGKKSKTNGYSTNVEVLMALRNEHPVIDLILRYREISKLLSTYINGMGDLLNGDRLHSIFKQTVTATGRLSSTEPNLQNIPIRKEEGRELRKLFIASVGCELIAADYSQIELRLLAHLSEDETLIEAFNNGDDVHRITAANVFGVPLEHVTSDMRRRAKAVNFGIIYGISDYGLASDINVSVSEAKVFIQKYFVTYPRIKEYLDNAVSFARKNGYQVTIANRIRLLSDINAKNYLVRSFSERVAMNMPMQGSASDLIKIAMINVCSALTEGGFKAKLILQVHDELIIDCPINEILEVRKILKEKMENAILLRVKIDVSVSHGRSWFDAK